MANNKAQSTLTKGRDIWVRARTNAFANELATANLMLWENWIFGIRVFFIVLPIVLVSLSVSTLSSVLSPGATPPDVSVFRGYSVLSIISNGIALFLTFISVRLRWGERASQFREQLGLFSLIAQKARRLEEATDKKDAAYLCRHLEELFETGKSRGIEPKDKFFSEAKRMIANLNTYPFGLTAEDFKT